MSVLGIFSTTQIMRRNQDHFFHPATLHGPGPLSLPGPMLVQVPYITKPPKFNPSIYLHYLLRFTHSPSVNFDLTLPPANTSTNHRGFSRHTLLESATKTPLSALTLISPHLSWSIEVTAPYGTYVTVHDVLDGIYRSLRANISSNDFRALRQKDQNRVTIAFEQRCLRSKKPEYERRMGVRRVDFLMGYTMFTGLTATNKGHDVWVLNTEWWCTTSDSTVELRNLPPTRLNFVLTGCNPPLRYRYFEVSIWSHVFPSLS